ncbi:MAG: hypothetical protein KatS3mg019_1525 [Fimbriimonadales bacterium]|nr:MAG: hypothetical protein KatS3mg019_1525 [Fimbriimonadales bacterium]
MNYNRIILVGRLTRDPELRATPDGISVVRFAIAVNRPTRQGEESQADYFDVVAFRQLADNVANYTTKGRLVLVEGRLQTRSYTDREGNQRKAYEVIADTIRFLERMRDSETEPNEHNAAAPYAAPGPRTVQRTAPTTPTHTAPEPEDDYDIELDTDEYSDIDDDPFR